jgi:hypothetical protein
MRELQSQESPKIDSQAILGLLGVYNSLGYKVHEIEKHFHGPARWLGATSAAGVGPGLITSLLPFKVIASDTVMTFGDAIVMFDGTEDFDFPFICTYFDPHYALVSECGIDNKIWKFRIASSGWNGTTHTYANMAEAVTAKAYTCLTVRIDDRQAVEVGIPVMAPRSKTGSIMWAQVMNDSTSADNEAARTIGYTIGLHCYQG